MTNLNKICMSALLLGAAAMTTPAFAQAADANSPQAQPSAPADAAPMDKAATSPSANNTQAAQAAEQPAANTQVAATSNSSQDIGAKSAANANVDAVGDTSKKYVRSHRAADFAKEQSITAQLNQQASAAAAPGSSVR